MNEADTCRLLVVPKLQSAGWDSGRARICGEVTFTDGRIVATGGSPAQRRLGKRADYILRYVSDMPLAVVEAKPDSATVGEGMQQAKEYAEILGLKFAYDTNGKEILEFDYLTGKEKLITAYPAPEELWQRLHNKTPMSPVAQEHILAPLYHLSDKNPRYYQEIAVNRNVQSIVLGKRRTLLTMATGTGKTFVAFQICWKLWSSLWNRSGAPRHPRILYLADRNILIDDPKDKIFAPFSDARWKIEGGVVNKSRQMYFAIYQALAEDISRPGLYQEYDRDFFDLIIVDECHRGSARESSNWREILEYFEPAFQLGMTATPMRDDNRDTYRYFGNPVYTYSLRQGIEDGFLAPYRVHRVVTEWDAAGWRPTQGDMDRYGREIPEDEYHTKDFERAISLRARTETVAKHLTNFLRETDRFAKTIVFCVDQEHADEMRRALVNLNADIVQQHPDYVCRVTSDEGDTGRGYLSKFQDVETLTPVILTTSQLLATGVDAPTCKNVVLMRVINSMTEFKQIIGRGTRVRDDYGKLFFSIIDYTGSATRLFADPDFDGDPEAIIEPEIGVIKEEQEGVEPPETTPPPPSPPPESTRKLYFDGGCVEIAAHLVYELDPDGKQLRMMTFTDYTGEKVRTLWRNAASLQAGWADPEKRREILRKLEERGIDFKSVAVQANQPEADPLDLLCHLAFNSPLHTRRERAQRLRANKRDFFESFCTVAQEILEELLNKYMENGTTGFEIPVIRFLSHQLISMEPLQR